MTRRKPVKSKSDAFEEWLLCALDECQGFSGESYAFTKALNEYRRIKKCKHSWISPDPKSTTQFEPHCKKCGAVKP